MAFGIDMLIFHLITVFSVLKFHYFLILYAYISKGKLVPVLNSVPHQKITRNMVG